MYYQIGGIVLNSEMVLQSFGDFICDPVKADVVLKETEDLPSTGSENTSGNIVQRKVPGGWFYHLIYTDQSGLWVLNNYETLLIKGENRGYVSVAEEGLVRMALECLLVRHGFVSLHAACICLDGEAIAFSGPSGIGKSTRAKSWIKAFDAELISGDRPLIDVRNLKVNGVPWDGKEKCYRNSRYPLKYICEVRRSDCVVYIRKMSFEQRRRLLMRQCFMPMWDTETAAIQMMNIACLAKSAEIIRVFCGRSDRDAIELQRSIMERRFEEEAPDMKAKNGFVLRNIVDEYILMPTGDNIGKFRGTLLFNEVSAFIWEKLQNPISREDLLEAIISEYEVSEELAAKDLDELLTQLREFGVIEDD